MLGFARRPDKVLHAILARIWDTMKTQVASFPPPSGLVPVE